MKTITKTRSRPTTAKQQLACLVDFKSPRLSLADVQVVERLREGNLPKHEGIFLFYSTAE